MADNVIEGTNYSSLQSPTPLYNSLRSAAAPVTSVAPTTSGGKTVNTLFLYNDLNIPDLFADAVYPGATKVLINTHKQLANEIGKYASIGTLVFYTHSGPGALTIGKNQKPSEDVDKLLSVFKTKVTDRIVFEGCSIMRDPIETCKMIKSIVNPETKAVGYNYLAITQSITFPFVNISDEAIVQKEFKRYCDKYWLKPLPNPTDAIGKNLRLGRRWFRELDDQTNAEDVPRGIFSYSDLLRKPIMINNLDEAVQLMADLGGPVNSAHLITASNITEIAKGKVP